jgi:CheY-like chemotaxis protein
MYNHQDLEFFYLGSEEEWTMERVTHHGIGTKSDFGGHAAAHASAHAAAHASSSAATHARKAKASVLILEDFDAIRALMSEHFKRQGFDVDSSATLNGALALSRDHAPNVLFIDYDLSSENPYNAIQQLHMSLPNTTIVLIGGPLTQTDQERALRAGASRIMEKGYDLSGMDQIASSPSTVTYNLPKVANA